jgi:hypothetical protein
MSKKDADKLRAVLGAGESPQHAAALFALRELTGRDAGKSYADWLKLYPDAADEAEAARLSNALIQARGDRRDLLLAQYRDEKGVVYTLALAAAISSLEGRPQDEAREALALRLARMKTTTLRERLREEEPELRRATVAALARKQDESVVPDLIGALEDNDRGVAEAAAAALRELTGKQYSSPRDWREWWRKGGSSGGS